MLRTFKRLVVASAVVVALTALLPVSSGAAEVAAATCRAQDVIKLEEWSHTALVTGQYAAAGAIDVRLTCGIVQNGVTVRRVSESAPGPVAVIAATTNIQGQYYSVCHEVTVNYVDHSTYADTCP